MGEATADPLPSRACRERGPLSAARKSGRQKRPLKFARIPHPTMRQSCIEIVSHSRNRKGYLQLRPRTGPRRSHVGAHRLAYLSKYGPDSIPPGYEVDHICGNRGCVNRKHLRVLSCSEHKRVTNATRYSQREEAAHCHWLATDCTGTALAAVFGVSATTTRRWIREWKSDPDA
ncbi:HNH endonuclease signature motif containing protein [Sphingomonas sp. IC081]|uniref:HNH endonuclease signature motif containing protein n=1 Tax=Sphingomonas sp. IC081 TaxID=304378 RepID=UPI00115BBD68|nr:HNH endonuclease [Sphingomonas sp. IC081]